MDNENRKIGGFLTFLLVLSLIVSIIGIVAETRVYMDKDLLATSNISTTSILISGILSLLMVVAVVMLLARSGIGAFILIGAIILSFGYNIFIAGFTAMAFVGLLLPIIILALVFRRKDVYFR